MAKNSSSDSAGAEKKRSGLFSRKPKAPKPEKKRGRFKQMIDVFNMTRRSDPAAVWLMLLVFLGAVLVGLVVGFLFNGNWITGLILGLAVGLMLAMLVLSRRAERAAFAQIEGKPGAAGAALSTLRRGWIVQEEPAAVNPRSQDALFRAVGRPGVVLVTEGPSHRVSSLVNAQQKRLTKILPNVPIHVLETGHDDGQVALRKVARTMRKYKNELTKAEVQAVDKRISSLGNKLPIPKGVDPYKARPDRKAMRGR